MCSYFATFSFGLCTFMSRYESRNEMNVCIVLLLKYFYERGALTASDGHK